VCVITGFLNVTSVEWTRENRSLLDRLSFSVVILSVHLMDCVRVLQVIDWIENHGEAFLSKHTGVGKSLHRARALQKRHDDFEEVAQVRQLLHSVRLIQNHQTNPHQSYLSHFFSDRIIQLYPSKTAN